MEELNRKIKEIQEKIREIQEIIDMDKKYSEKHEIDNFYEKLDEKED